MVNEIHISVMDLEQLDTVLSLENKIFSRIYIDYSIAEEAVSLIDKFDNIDFYISSPYVSKEDETLLIEKLLLTHRFKGILIRNFEIFSFLNLKSDKFDFANLILDSNMYLLNHNALYFYSENSKLKLMEFYSSLELNERENAELINYDNRIKESFLVYGRIPMMVTANCVRKTSDNCIKHSNFILMEDRYHIEFPVLCNCLSCYNVIYNSVVLSLHKQFSDLIKKGNVRIDFTNENEKSVKEIIDYFGRLKDSYCDPKYKNFTTGHFKRGVE